jgi:hypothetical protein
MNATDPLRMVRVTIADPETRPRRRPQPVVLNPRRRPTSGGEFVAYLRDHPLRPRPTPVHGGRHPEPRPPAQPDIEEMLPGIDLDAMNEAALRDLVVQMATDFHTLNGIHNVRAERNEWCPEYEERQQRHNERLTVLKLVGRRQLLPNYTNESGL